VYHTFQGGCKPPGDRVIDTPLEADANWTCSDPQRDSCPKNPGFDPVNNYMNYVPDFCRTEFTAGQRKAMRKAWLKYRSPARLGAAREAARELGVTKTGGSFELLQEKPHDPTVHTQGLQPYYFMCFCPAKGRAPTTSTTVVESIGKYGSSSVRQVDLMSGKVVRQHNLPSKYFGQGITYIPPRNNAGKARLVQLTWREKTGFLYDADTLDPLDRFSYTTSTTQGWGIAYRSNRHTLLVTDGSQWLHTWNADTMKEISPRRKIYTRQAASGTMVDKPLTKVFELEWDTHSDTLLGIVYKRGTIVRIDPDTGLVINMYDVSSLYPNRAPGAGALSGIALTPIPGEIWVTGQSWPASYLIRLTE
jgi:glutaminyl-peptide cyclotransferase